MKKILFVCLAFAVLISCKNEPSKEEIIKNNIATKLKTKFKNPDSYEFVSMKLVDSFTVKERRKFANQESLEEIREINKTLPSPDLLKSIETEYNFLKNQTDENKIAIYRYDFVAKGTNSYGGIIQSKYLVNVLNDKNYTVTSTSKND